MKSLSRLIAIAACCAIPFSAHADLFTFSYTFDANQRGTPGSVITGTVDGKLKSDGDTIVIDSFVSATLGGYAYEITSEIGIRAGDPGDLPTMSLSGDTIDFWVCPQGFIAQNNGGGDCSFGIDGGGFLLSNTLDLPDIGYPDQGQPLGLALAGIPQLSDIFESPRYREFDNPMNQANWQAAPVSRARVSFSYMFDGSIRGTPGQILEGEVEGILMPDGDTVIIERLLNASLDGISYGISPQDMGIRAFDLNTPAVLSLSGNELDFWICPLGFTEGPEGEEPIDCRFGAEGGFFISEYWDFSGGNLPPGVAWAGIPELGSSYRVGDQPIVLEDWQASITKLKAIKLKAAKKEKKPKKN